MTNAEKTKLLQRAVELIAQAQMLAGTALEDTDARWDMNYALQDVIDDLQADIADNQD